jgi:hypothetical protein
MKPFSYVGLIEGAGMYAGQIRITTYLSNLHKILVFIRCLRFLPKPCLVMDVAADRFKGHRPERSSLARELATLDLVKDPVRGSR